MLHWIVNYFLPFLNNVWAFGFAALVTCVTTLILVCLKEQVETGCRALLSLLLRLLWVGVAAFLIFRASYAFAPTPPQSAALIALSQGVADWVQSVTSANTLRLEAPIVIPPSEEEFEEEEPPGAPQRLCCKTQTGEFMPFDTKFPEKAMNLADCVWPEMTPLFLSQDNCRPLSQRHTRKRTVAL
jgi:hypothetical protein